MRDAERQLGVFFLWFIMRRFCPQTRKPVRRIEADFIPCGGCGDFRTQKADQRLKVSKSPI